MHSYLREYFRVDAKRSLKILDLGSHAAYISIALKRYKYDIFCVDMNKPEIKCWLDRHRTFDLELTLYDLHLSKSPFRESLRLYSLGLKYLTSTYSLC